MKKLLTTSLTLCLLVLTLSSGKKADPNLACMCTYKKMKTNGQTGWYWFQCYGGSKKQCGSNSQDDLVSASATWSAAMPTLQGLCSDCNSFSWSEAY